MFFSRAVSGIYPPSFSSGRRNGSSSSSRRGGGLHNTFTTNGHMTMSSIPYVQSTRIVSHRK